MRTGNCGRLAARCCVCVFSHWEVKHYKRVEEKTLSLSTVTTCFFVFLLYFQLAYDGLIFEECRYDVECK